MPREGAKGMREEGREKKRFVEFKHKYCEKGGCSYVVQTSALMLLLLFLEPS